MQLRWCAAAAVLVGCGLAHNYTDPTGPRYEGAFSRDPQAASRLPLLEAVTFNIKFGRKHERAVLDLKSSPALARADILLLQEMDAAGTESIARALELDYVYYPGSVQHGRDFGNAVLSRWPIVSDQKILLPHESPTDGRIRIAVCAELRTPLGDILAYSVHNETPWLGPRARLEQAEAVLEHARSSTLSTIIGGDFNTGDPGALDATVSLYGRDGFVWASRANGSSLGTLDLAFVRYLLPLQSGSQKTAASDHDPVWVEVELPPP